MKKRTLPVLAFLAILFLPDLHRSLFAQTGPSAAEPKVIILQPENRSDIGKYNNSEVIRSIVHNSVNTFIGIIPGILLTNAVSDTNWKFDEAADAFSKWNADYVLYGTFSLQGPKMNPTALIEWRVWSKAVKKDILVKNYKTLTDIEIFDAIDDMITNSAKALLKREIGISVLAFNNFRINNAPHAVILNDKTVSVASNDNFSLSLKVPSDSRFRFQIKRRSDGKTVSSGTVSLPPGESTNISYHAPAGLQLFYEQETFYLQTGVYISGTNRYDLGLFGAPDNLLRKLGTAPSNRDNLERYSWNRIWGWSLLGAGIAGTLFVFSLGNTNLMSGIPQSQRGLIGLASITTTLGFYILSGMFFNFADNDLEKAVRNYNRFILFENTSSMYRNEIMIGLFCLKKEF